MGTAAVRDGHGQGVPGGRDHPQDRLPVAVRARGVLPVRLDDAVRSHRYLSLLERQRIAALRANGDTVREIARVLQRSSSTISRELKRNTARHDRGGYDAVLAQARARSRGARPGRSRLANDEQLRAIVQGKLEMEWSPE